MTKEESMLPVVTAAEMSHADNAAITGLSIGESRLMEIAGMRFADCITNELPGIGFDEDNCYLVVCGKGNNGGDGFVAARHLLNRGSSVDLVLLYPSSALSATNNGALSILEAYLEHTDTLRIFRSVAEALPFVMESRYNALIDAILGTGLKTDGRHTVLADPVRDGIALLNALREQSGAPIAAVDVPSGLDATSGIAANPAVTADLTVTMAFMKTGFFLNDGPLLSGSVTTAEISIPEFLLEDTVCRLIDQEFAAEHYRLREISGAKHTNGKVLVIAGSRSPRSSMIGAALLSTKAAVHTGAGYVCACLPEASMSVMHTAVPEAIVVNQDMDSVLEKIRWADAVLIGCGLGRESGTIEFIRELLDNPEISAKKLVIDADALYAIAETPGMLEKAGLSNAVLTPHYGELSRLTGIPAETIAEDPINMAREFAAQYGVNILLKGNPTVLADHEGHLLLNNSGTEALSTAGSGDILAGMIAAMAAKGAGIFDAAAAASWFHGRAGDLADDVSSLVSAGGILDAIPKAIHEIFEREE